MQWSTKTAAFGEMSVHKTATGPTEPRGNGRKPTGAWYAWGPRVSQANRIKGSADGPEKQSAWEPTNLCRDHAVFLLS